MRRRARALAWAALATAYGLALAGVWTADQMQVGQRFGATAFITLCAAGVLALAAMD